MTEAESTVLRCRRCQERLTEACRVYSLALSALSMAFAVTSEMRRWAASAVTDGTHTVILTAFLTPLNGAGQQQIAGSFIHSKTSSADMLKQMALFVEGSAAALSSGHVKVHVIHDTRFGDDHSAHLPCVRFHRMLFGDDVAETSIRLSLRAIQKYTSIQS